MNALLLAVSVVMNLLACGILRNDFCKSEIQSDADLHAFNAISSVLSAVTLTVISLFSQGLRLPSPYTLLLGMAFGLATALCAVLHMKALETGPLSYTNVIISCAMVIPALSGLLFFGEQVTWGQCIGIALMVLSFVCAVDVSGSSMGTSVKWFLLCLGSFLCSGAVGVMQKVHQSSAHRDELSVFLIIAFLVSAAFSAFTARQRTGKGQRLTVFSVQKRRKLLFVSLLCGVGIALCNQFNMYLAGVMDAMIFYPVVNGGSMLLTTAAGVLLWHEKPTPRQWFGLVIGGAAIFLLCGIF